MTNPVWKIETICLAQQVDGLEEIFAGHDGFSGLSDFEEGEKRKVDAFFTEKPDAEKLRAEIGVDFTLELLKDQDWVSQSQKLLTPVEAGQFFVYGSHDSDKVPPDCIAICIEAGQAFGTGQHETTHGCLRALDELVGEISPENILDLGSGSGVLAIACAKLWPVSIIASDIDPIATDTAGQNTEINGVPFINTLTSDGFENIAVKSFDLITANILAGPLRDMAEDIAAHLAPEGILILSGLLTTQEDGVLNAYLDQGLQLKKKYILGEWSTLVLEKR